MKKCIICGINFVSWPRVCFQCADQNEQVVLLELHGSERECPVCGMIAIGEKSCPYCNKAKKKKAANE